jgi:hypothetical protein
MNLDPAFALALSPFHDLSRLVWSTYDNADWSTPPTLSRNKVKKRVLGSILLHQLQYEPQHWDQLIPMLWIRYHQTMDGIQRERSAYWKRIHKQAKRRRMRRAAHYRARIGARRMERKKQHRQKKQKESQCEQVNAGMIPANEIRRLFAFFQSDLGRSYFRTPESHVNHSFSIEPYRHHPDRLIQARHGDPSQCLRQLLHSPFADQYVVQVEVVWNREDVDDTPLPYVCLGAQEDPPLPLYETPWNDSPLSLAVLGVMPRGDYLFLVTPQTSGACRIFPKEQHWEVMNPRCCAQDVHIIQRVIPHSIHALHIVYQDMEYVVTRGGESPIQDILSLLHPDVADVQQEQPTTSSLKSIPAGVFQEELYDATLQKLREQTAYTPDMEEK